MLVSSAMGAVLREVVIDCVESRRTAEFWGDVLGWEVQQNEGVLWMSESGAPFPDLLLVFAQVPERKAVKNRLHLDVSPIGCGGAATSARAMLAWSARGRIDSAGWANRRSAFGRDGTDRCRLGEHVHAGAAEC